MTLTLPHHCLPLSPNPKPQSQYSLLTIPAESFLPSEFCKNVELYFLPASRLELPAESKLSSEIFLERTPNSFSVVQNDKGAKVGQILTPGIEGPISPDPGLYPRPTPSSIST